MLSFQNELKVTTMNLYFNQLAKTLSVSVLVLFLVSCIGDDFLDDMIDPELRITASIQELGIGDSFQFEKIYLNNVGEEEIVEAFWTTSNTAIIDISETGLATAVAPGNAIISVSTFVDNAQLIRSVEVTVGAETIQTASSISGQIRTTTFYTLEGSFTLSQEGDDLLLEIGSDYEASSALPGLYIYLSNNINSIANALEIEEVEVFSGAHEFLIPDTSLQDFAFIVYFCKPFNVKVGDATL